MVIRLDENYNAMTSTALLGYVGETNARPVSFEGMEIDGADRYVLTIDYGDGVQYEVDITGGQWTPTADILRSAQTQLLQRLRTQKNLPQPQRNQPTPQNRRLNVPKPQRQRLKRPLHRLKRLDRVQKPHAQRRSQRRTPPRYQQPKRQCQHSRPRLIRQ